MMKISVIIVAYNAEKHLEETLENVLNQTIDDYEVIVVDDGSTDRTLEILKRYKKNYSHLNIISKESSGLSSARNKGIEHAQGEYIYFFDADDILTLDALESLYNVANEKKADLVIAKYDIFNNEKVIEIRDIDALVKQTEINKYDPRILWTFSLCNKLFKRSVIEQNNLYLPPISYFEDGVFLFSYIYYVSKIVGLDKVIFYYRRMDDKDVKSITSSLNYQKVADYIEVHRIILNKAEQSILRDYPEYKSIKEAKEKNSSIRDYLNTIIKKEVHALLRQFYTKFWDIEEDIVKLIVTEIKKKLEELDMKEISMLQAANPEYSIFSLWEEKGACLRGSYITAVLFGEKNKSCDFLRCLHSLSAQNFVPMKIVVPFSMKEYIEKNGEFKANMVFIDADSENEFFHSSLERTTSDYIIFCNHRFLYANDLFKRAYRYLKKDNIDFYSEVVCHSEYGVPQQMTISRIMYNKFKQGKEYNEYIYMDYLLANKFFNVKFLKGFIVHKSEMLLDVLPMIFKKAYYLIEDNSSVLFNGSEEEYTEYIKKSGSKDFIDNYFHDGKVSLNDSGITRAAGEALSKLVIHPHKWRLDNIVKKSMVIFKNMPLKNRVLFYSIRKEGELEGNAKALYPYINGKKAVFSKLNPHNHLKQIQGLQMVMSSKVIVTDDYVRYLKHFPLRPEQRVIQLWHACGAFKKFGQRGTNMSLEMDRATHAQYNLVCVSGHAVRNIYADAFDVDIRKVRALGCPRTDAFFDEKLIQQTKQKVYAKYPKLRKKYVIIYAPTFRDVGNDRKNFKPEIDFDKLSEELLPNQTLVICPHPIMQNEIISKEYPNIQVIRDFSTNDMMFVSDMLITDYSSVIFEYAILRKPIVFYCYDLPTYDRGFYLKYPEDLPGEICKTQSELVSFLRTPEKHTITEKHTVFVEKYMSGCDGHSCERIAEIINSYMKEHSCNSLKAPIE